ncbi:YisL family protein [Ornithinibacillus scapharcae]|uniref:YisL family protein n=1 Tax=Ornithinibacillus scapharcae TaxID=1147159 RepID=UPI000225B556|nr:YisL family protein [Ornithinibacillus scapharcae]
MNTHLHITAWALALILFIVAIILHKQGKQKGAKIVQMVLRLDYLLILYSGGDLIANYFGGDSPMMVEAIIKGIAGVWVIAAMEMTLGKIKDNDSAKAGWIQLIIALAITIALGFFRLPGGLLP